MMVSLVVMLYLSDPVFGYGGWGPGEDYGHAGRNPPRKNWNALYGYDNTDTLHDRFNYTAAVEEKALPPNLRSPLVVSVVPDVSQSSLQPRDKALSTQKYINPKENP